MERQKVTIYFFQLNCRFYKAWDENEETRNTPTINDDGWAYTDISSRSLYYNPYIEHNACIIHIYILQDT